MSETPPVFDGHNDAALAVWRGETTLDALRDGREDGHLDLPRARAGGLAGGAFAVFVPSGEQFAAGRDENRVETPDGYRIRRPPPLAPPFAADAADEMLAVLDDLVATEGVRRVETAADLRACVDGEDFGVLVHLEGAEPVHPSLSNFDDYYDRGVRSLGLAWSRPTAFADGVPFRYPSGPDVGGGLTDRGRRLVARCNDAGVLVDCAHLPEAGFWDVHDASRDPLVVSHAGAHEQCHSSRNLTDEQLDAVADTGGLVGLTFAAGALRADGSREPDAPVDELLRHVDHVVDRVGVDHVALGSDFDGAAILDGVGDASGVPRIFDALRDAGYGDRDLRKLAHGNWLRVCEASW
ncbi:dipeptidase [Halobacterium yunchengense]|uniref:dipeptidase n=1 Tax=Halobacterium yunchengense TaxID=3108497 RepID=UPI00300BEEFB